MEPCYHIPITYASVSNIKDSQIGYGTKGFYVRVADSRIGEENELNPFADISNTTTSAKNIIGHVMRYSNLARGFISRHIPTEIYYLNAPPGRIRIGNKIYEMANPMNIGAGAHIMGRKGRSVTIRNGAFIGSNAWLGPAVVIWTSFVLGEVPAGKEILPFTFYDSHAGTELLGELLKPRLAGVNFRTFIYKGKFYTPAMDRWIGDYFIASGMNILNRGIRKELNQLESGGQTPHSEEKLNSALSILKETKKDGRWKMKDHRFEMGTWLYDKPTDSWKWRPNIASKIANSIGTAKILSYDGTKPIEKLLTEV